MTKKITLTAQEIEFLNESNRIENVTDAISFKQAAFAWQYLREEKELSIGTILKTHKILMLHSNLMPDQKGYFRHIQVYIAGREGIRHELIRSEIDSWVRFANGYPAQWYPHHVKFEHIHPFVDGNGRVGRMLLNWQRLKAGLDILVIKYDERSEYYKWF